MDESDLNRELSVTLVGIGGIGTPLLSPLMRLPLKKITFWDDDVIGKENLANQLWDAEDIGCAKALAASDLFSRRNIPTETHSARFSGGRFFDSVVISAVDSLESRRAIWRGIRGSNGRVKLLIDGRLSRENPYFFQLFAIPVHVPERCADYEAWLEGEDAADSGRRDHDMIPAPIVLSGLIMMYLIRWSRGEPLPWQVVWDGMSMVLMPTFD